jgi:hypothetical protein
MFSTNPIGLTQTSHSINSRKPESVASCFSLRRRNYAAFYAARQQTSRLLSSQPNILLFGGRYPQLWFVGKSSIENPATRITPAGQTLAIRNYAKWGKAAYCCSGPGTIGAVLGMDCCRGHSINSIDCPSPGPSSDTTTARTYTAYTSKSSCGTISSFHLSAALVNTPIPYFFLLSFLLLCIGMDATSIYNIQTSPDDHLQPHGHYSPQSLAATSFSEPDSIFSTLRSLTQPDCPSISIQAIIRARP